MTKVNITTSKGRLAKIKQHYEEMDVRAIAVVTAFEALTNQQKIAIRDNLGNQAATQAQRITSLEVAWAFEHLNEMAKR